MAKHRKQVKHFHEPGDFHELTFSCYLRMPLLANDSWRRLLCRSIDRAIERSSFRLIAFVLMPEHVHLLVLPTTRVVHIDKFLSAIKQPHSVRIKRILQQTESPLLEKCTVQKRPGKMAFRYWQDGPGYDRNLFNEKAIIAAIDYIHENPVRRGLCRRATDWNWSTARWYVSDGSVVDPDLPKIHGLPPQFFDT